MTPGEAFEKAAMDRFQEVKLASLGHLLKQVGGWKGLSEAMGKGEFGQTLGKGYRKLNEAQQAAVKGQALGAGAGMIGGALMGDERDSLISRMVVPAAMGFGGLHLGKPLGGMFHGFQQG